VGQCRGQTKGGRRCQKTTADKSHYCNIHKKTDWLNDVVLPVAGAVAGWVVAPGVGGLLIGGAVGKVAGAMSKENGVGKRRVFVSFDYDHDVALKEFLVGQAKHPDSPFEIENWSINEPVVGDWKKKAKERISRADQIVVICGEHTHTAKGVSIELGIAQEDGKPYFLLKGYKDSACTKPSTARSTDKMQAWTWENLKGLIGGGR